MSSVESRELEKKLEAYINSDVQERAEAAKERALMKQDVEYIKKAVESISKKLDSASATYDNRYVTKEEFRPYKVAMNTLAVTLLLGIAGALLSLILIQ